MVTVMPTATMFWTTLLMASVAAAIWPAFPSEMGASAGGSDYSQSSQKRRLHHASFSDVGDSCSCTSEFRAVDSRSRETEANVEELQNEVNGMYSTVNTLKNAVASLSSGQGRRLSAAQSYNIAFSARVGYNRPYLGETEVIVFDELVINNGDVYDPYSGKFTSPVPGLYHFETTILSGFNATIETMIVLNGNEMGRIFSGGFNTRGSGSNSLLLNMEEGDEVWVSVFFGNGDYVHGLWSTFSGYLVYSYDNV